MRPIVQRPRLCLVGVLAVAAAALAGCASSNLAQNYSPAPESTPVRAREATVPAVQTPRRATVRRDDDVDETSAVATPRPSRRDTSRQVATGRSNVANDAASTPKPLSDEWLKLEEAKEDKLRRTMNICRGC